MPTYYINSVLVRFQWPALYHALIEQKLTGQSFVCLQRNQEITPLFLLVKKFKLSDRSWIQGEMHKLLLLFSNMVNWKQVCGGILEILPFSYLLPVFTGIEPGTFRSKGQRVNSSATRPKRAWAKMFRIQSIPDFKQYDLLKCHVAI